MCKSCYNMTIFVCNGSKRWELIKSKILLYSSKQTYKSAKYQWMNFANLSFFQPIPAIIAIITKEKKTAKKRSIESKWSRGLGHEIRKDSKSSGSQDIDCQSASCVQRMSKMLEGSRLQIKVLEVLINHVYPRRSHLC